MATASAEGDKLTLGYLFVNGLRTKVDDIKVLIKNHDIDVLALCRTNLDSRIDDAEIEIDLFQVSRKDRNPVELGPGGSGGSGGGVVIYFKESIDFQRMNAYENKDVETIWLTLSPNGWRKLLVGCCYRPTQTRKSYLDEINEQITGMTQNMTDQDIFLMGTFNIGWNKNTPERRRLNTAATTCGLRQIVDEPYGDDTEKVNDLIFTNIQEDILNVQSIDKTPSNHRLFLVTVNRNSTIGTTGGATGGATGGTTGEDKLSSKMEKLDIEES